MIKENIQININDKSFDAEIIAPSQVMTSTPQEETVDLTKSPNFVLKVQDAEKTINVTDIVEVSFSLGDYNYTANMKAYNRGGGIIALQYDSNLTAEEVTHTFECVSNQLETSKDLNSGDIVSADTHFLYDAVDVRAEDISFGPLNYHTITVGEPTPEDITLTPKSSFPEISTGEFNDTLTATYKGITITVPVTLTITRQEEVLPLEITFMGGDHQQINPITEMLNDQFTVIDPNVIDQETGTYMDVTMMCEYSGVRDGSEPMTNVELDAGRVNINVPGTYTITATEPTTGHTGTTTLIVDAALPQSRLQFDATDYYATTNMTTGTDTYSDPIILRFDGVALQLEWPSDAVTFSGDAIDNMLCEITVDGDNVCFHAMGNGEGTVTATYEEQFTATCRVHCTFITPTE